MKKYISIFVVMLLAFNITSCEEDTLIFNSINGQTALSFTTSSYNISIPTEGLTIDIPVQVTTVSNTSRSFNVTVVDSLSTGGASNYTIGGIVIPADSYSGVLSVAFNFDPLVDGEVNTLVLSLTAPEDGSVYNGTVRVEYFKEVVCNDYKLTIEADRYASETSWEITDSAGVVVVSGGPFADIPGGATYISEFTLEDGCYTFTFFDSYGDGQSDGTITGTYNLECSILQAVSGEGALANGSFESTDFCVNQ